MAYIPRDSTWYVAELIEEISVDGDDRNVIHRNLMLVQASSPEEAYEKSTKLGIESECRYLNPDGRAVEIKYRGLGALNVVHDRLEHGAELKYEELVDVPEDDIAMMIPPKTSLSVFREVNPSLGPDYSSMEVMKDVARVIASDKK